MIKGWYDMEKGVEVKAGAYNNEVAVRYDGLLKKSGADRVFIHYGGGSPTHWNSIATQEMDCTTRGFEKTMRVSETQAHICFKDSADHWDNNSGHNWTIRQ